MNRQVFNVWRPQRNMSDVTDDILMAIATALTVMPQLEHGASIPLQFQTLASRSVRYVRHTNTALSYPKINPRLPAQVYALPSTKIMYLSFDAAVGFPNCNDFSMAERWQNVCNVAALFHDALRLRTRFELNICFALFCVSPGPGMNTSSCLVDTWRHLRRHNSNELPSDVTKAINGRSLLRNFALRDADWFQF